MDVTNNSENLRKITLQMFSAEGNTSHVFVRPQGYTQTFWRATLNVNTNQRMPLIYMQNFFTKCSICVVKVEKIFYLFACLLIHCLLQCLQLSVAHSCA